MNFFTRIHEWAADNCKYIQYPNIRKSAINEKPQGGRLYRFGLRLFAFQSSILILLIAIPLLFISLTFLWAIISTIYEAI